MPPAPACDLGAGGTRHPQREKGQRPPDVHSPTVCPLADPSSLLFSPFPQAQWLTFLERSLWAGICAKRFLVRSLLVASWREGQ